MTDERDHVQAPSDASEDPNDTGTLPSNEGERISTGTRFGAYTVGPLLAHGRMARIYRARHEGLRRQVALKVLIDGFARNPDGVERFLREARNAAAIKHQNVVDIFDVGTHGGMPYLVMELLEGEDLATRLATKGPLSEAELVDVMVPIVAGLAAVHDAGVLHRNLKPANIFLSRGRNDELVPKLFDFGISKAAWSDQLKLTLPNRLLMGTPEYMSPEAIRGAPMTVLSDQYSLGVVMYECITGVNPCAGESFADTLRIITTGDFGGPMRHKPQVSRHLNGIIERAMSPEPADRFADMRELGRELLMLAGKRTRITWDLTFGETTVALSRRAAVTTVIELAPEAHQRTKERPRRRGLMLLTAGLLTLTALAGAAFVLDNPRFSLPTPLQSAATTEVPPSALSFPLSPKPRAVEAPSPSEAPPRAAQEAPQVRVVHEDQRAREAEAAALPPRAEAPAPKPPERRPTRRLGTPRAAPRSVGSPDWLVPAHRAPTPERISAAPPRAASSTAQIQIGTNNAPILD